MWWGVDIFGCRRRSCDAGLWAVTMSHREWQSRPGSDEEQRAQERANPRRSRRDAATFAIGQPPRVDDIALQQDHTASPWMRRLSAPVWEGNRGSDPDRRCERGLEKL